MFSAYENAESDQRNSEEPGGQVNKYMITTDVDIVF